MGKQDNTVIKLKKRTPEEAMVIMACRLVDLKKENSAFKKKINDLEKQLDKIRSLVDDDTLMRADV